MNSLAKFALLVSVVFLLGAEPEPKAAKPPKADVRGAVTSISVPRGGGLIGVLLVEGKKEADTQYDKASVTILAGATIEKWVDGKKVKATFGDIKNGSIVQCVFTGPVAESYPVQARTKEVLILQTPKAK